ncbi:penicillin acylase family protein [Microlunatus elymi]|uniref:Penicillin acylase family protein n=1 Tax=Microlunatus elymi TaxID=2596828 RepID=A0A516Q364_9ACTN|nr:penicillin acylase family protein [Microlunatus elymi]QDP97867.1 penicillin acylase family protein [Microlunatus elymi]
MVAEVFRDPWGIPHLRADSVDELARLQGRIAATDRAWQLEWNRRRAEGRTAEVVGSAGVTFDRFARRARIDETARRGFDRLDPRTRNWCTAYVDGVNDGLDAGAAGAYEFVSLEIGPGRWQPWTPLAVFAVQQLLFGGFPYKLWRRHIDQRLGQGAIGLLESAIEDSPGSNAWAVTGDRARGGLPMIAGDSHRTMDFPGVYQQVRLACPEFDVIGFSFPGVPGIQHFGHAGEVAWAITNAMADYQDLFLEELRADGDQLSARGPDGWRPVRHSEELIMVRGGEPVPVKINITERGPVIIDEPDGPTISLRTPSQVEADLGFGALLPLLRARTVDDVTAALSHWVEPVNSALIADRAGAVRHLIAGRVPIRDDRNLDVPVPAWDPRHAWTGDYAQVPYDEVTDLTANGNDRASGGGLGRYYASDWRATRIRRRLGALPPRSADAEAMSIIHRDVRSGPGGRAVELIRAAEVDGPAKLIKDELVDWDAEMTADSRPALLYAAWREAMIDWLLEQPALARLHDPDPLPALYDAVMNVPYRIGSSFDTICANADRLGLDLNAGVVSALEAVAADPPHGTWGDVHRLSAVHALTDLADDHVPPMPQTRLAGDTGCVFCTHSSPGISHECSFASVTRYAWDLSDRSASRWVVPFGSSGRPDSPHHLDQHGSWARGELLPVITDWAQLIKEE